MHRLAIANNLRRDYDLDENENSPNRTPLRGNRINPPRRLLVLDFEPAVSSQNPAAPTQSSKPGSHKLDQGNFTPTTNFCNITGDRFIPRRRGVNFDISHYNLTKKHEKEKDNVYLDVFEEIKNATERWRKKYMDNAFENLNIFNGIECKRILSYGESPSPSKINMKKLKVREFNDECQWDCKARKQPHMSMKGENSKRYRDHGAQIFRFAMSIKLKNLIDWSSKNVLAAGLADSACMCDVDAFKNLSKIHRVDHTAYICCVKWNEQGTQLAISGMDGSTSIYDTTLSKNKWTCKCPRYDEITRKCHVVGTLWVKKDNQIINACDEGCLNIIDTSDGRVINTHVFDREILAISISPKEQYLVISCSDKLVKVFDYQSWMQMFEIVFFAPVKAFAWHPWSSGILCIGGGPGDASLSLWNVNSERQLGYRKVRFVGSVDTIMFNKLSGELLVHWYYLENDRIRSKIAILAGLDRIVDAVPIQPEHRMLNIVWSPDHTKLAMQHRDTLVIWNFFGYDRNKWNKVKYKRENKDTENHLRNYSLDTQTCTGPHTTVANAKRGKGFSYYNIR